MPVRVKRLIATLGASFDTFVSKVENHEAVADAVIADVRSAAARLKVQSGRVGAQLARLQTQREQLAAERDNWRRRAAQLADDDEPRALRCLQQARHSEQRLGLLDEQLEQHTQLRDSLAADLARVEARLNELHLKRGALSSRAARADALRAGESLDTCQEAFEVFERWETSVVEDEYRETTLRDGVPDDFERGFRETEERDELLAELAELKAQARPEQDR